MKRKTPKYEHIYVSDLITDPNNMIVQGEPISLHYPFLISQEPNSVLINTHLFQELPPKVAGGHVLQVGPGAHFTANIAVHVGSLQYHSHHDHSLGVWITTQTW